MAERVWLLPFEGQIPSKGSEISGGFGRGKGVVEREKRREERFLGVGVWHENKEKGLASGPTCA